MSFCVNPRESDNILIRFKKYKDEITLVETKEIVLWVIPITFKLLNTCIYILKEMSKTTLNDNWCKNDSINITIKQL